ncbi:peptidase M28, partial [Actinoplanes sp. NPDC026623]
MRRTRLARAVTALAVTTACAVSVVSPASAAYPARAPAPAPGPAAAADRLVGSAAAAPALRLAPEDTLHRTGVVEGTRGLRYVTYSRTHAGVPVVGGDVVVTTDAAGAVKGTAVAQGTTIDVPATATVTAASATRRSAALLAEVDETRAARLVVLAWSATPRLAWETVVSGRTAANRPSVLHVFVDARTGAVLDQVDDVREGTGNGYYYGEVSLDTSGTEGAYSLTDTTRPGLKCGGQNGSAYTGTDDAWGNGSGTNLETACVDALWSAQREADMFSAWFNRNGILGNGNTPPIRVGLADV